MSSQVATLYGANIVGVGQRDGLPEVEHVRGAVGWPLSCLAALISSWLAASGCAELTLMPYFAVKRVDDRRRSWPSPAAAR